MPSNVPFWTVYVASLNVSVHYTRVHVLRAFWLHGIPLRVRVRCALLLPSGRRAGRAMARNKAPQARRSDRCVHSPHAPTRVYVQKALQLRSVPLRLRLSRATASPATHRLSRGVHQTPPAFNTNPIRAYTTDRPLRDHRNVPVGPLNPSERGTYSGVYTTVARLSHTAATQLR